MAPPQSHTKSYGSNASPNNMSQQGHNNPQGRTVDGADQSNVSPERGGAGTAEQEVVLMNNPEIAGGIANKHPRTHRHCNTALPYCTLAVAVIININIDRTPGAADETPLLESSTAVL